MFSDQLIPDHAQAPLTSTDDDYDNDDASSLHSDLR